MISPFRTLVASTLVLAGPAGAALYQQDFTTDDTANWAVRAGPSTVDVAANFFFDYSTVGIPSAPNGSGTRGMKLQANLSSGVLGAINVTPTSVVLPSNYTLTFDWWANTIGATTSPGFPVGGSSSANLSTFGVGTAASTTSAAFPGSAQDSV